MTVMHLNSLNKGYLTYVRVIGLFVSFLATKQPIQWKLVGFAETGHRFSCKVCIGKMRYFSEIKRQPISLIR